jgi:hypothetical protein
VFGDDEVRLEPTPEELEREKVVSIFTRIPKDHKPTALHFLENLASDK